jgi:rhamnosyltransferase
MDPVTKNDVAAVVVLYRPAPDVIENIAAFAAQVDRVYAVDNSEEPDPQVVEALRSIADLEYVPLGENLGIATALNVGARRALEAEYSWILTMDQDSTVTRGMVGALLHCVQKDRAKVGLVSPVHRQVGGEPRVVEPGCHEVLTAMTSGNLVSIGALERVGWFMDDLFIDQVDNEICLRFWRAGLRVVESGDADLVHRVGDVRRHRFPYPAYSSNHPPIRRYYIARNRLWVARMYAADYPQFARFERKQQLKDVVKIVLYEREKSQKLAMVWRGWRDYRRGVTGPYAR